MGRGNSKNTKELYKRFAITVDQEKAISIFRNKIKNILCHGELGEKIFDSPRLQAHWQLCNILGLEYSSLSYVSSQVVDIFEKDLDFSEYIFRIQILLDFLWNNDENQLATNLVDIIEEAINTSSVDLGVRLKFYKRKGVQIYFSGSKLLDKKLVDDVLGVLEDEEKSAVKLVFEKGLKEFLEAKSNPPKLKNAVRDMQLACDETMKTLFEDKNLGFKHLFRDDRWRKAGLNEYQKQIYWNLNEYIDKFVKHKSDAKINSEDAENIIYLTGMFIRLVFLKSERTKL